MKSSSHIGSKSKTTGILLYGVHAVSAALQNPDRTCYQLWVTDSGLEAIERSLQAAQKKGLKRPSPQVVERRELDRLVPGSVHQGIVLEVTDLPERSLEDVCQQASSQDTATVVVLDQVTDPHNVGAILRSASAFGTLAVIVTDRHAPDSTGTLAKSASGALEHVWIVRVTNLARALSQLQKAGFWCVGLDETGERTLAQMDLSGKTALVLGAEGAGLRRLTIDSCDDIARLPTSGPVGTLNVSNAAAVSLYEVARQKT